TRSFTQAAEELGIGKARVSQIITKLEQELNARLLNRTTRSLSLTDSGLNYYQKCQMIQELVAQANFEVQNISSQPSGIIRISMPVESTIFIKLLSDFLLQYPQLQLDLIETDSYSNLIESRCDIAIRASSALEDFNSSLHAVKIGEFNEVLCASPEYLKHFDLLESAQDLLKLDWVAHEVVHGDKPLRLKSPQGVTIKLSQQPKVQVRTSSSLKSFLVNGIGFGVMPDFAIKEELENGQLVRILPEAYEVTIPLYAVYQNKALMPLRTRTLIDFLKREGGIIQTIGQN
ncbi:MAG TPA: LysR family transcriptional regulator, partial [Shewanella frigidimarina]|nr:LysR family transcriptional regulator [Shewanella frigidimarina]